MVLIKNFNDILYVAANDKVAILNVSSGAFNIHKPQANNQDKPSEVVCLALSEQGNFKAISTISKHLFVYDEKMELIRETLLQRCASKVRFTKNNDLIIADKTGDAYIWNFKEGINEPFLILGHLSMLLDVLLTDCGRFVITSDRDEKIRVTNYPNTYNIQSYCLGHSEYVNTVEVINNVLITSSGDGTIGFWDYRAGKLLNSIDTNSNLSKEMVNSFCKSMSAEHMEIKAVPILDMQIFVSDEILIAALLGGVHIIQIYKITISKDNKINVLYLDSLQEKNLWSFCFDSNLYVLCTDKFVCYEIINNKLSLTRNDNLNNIFNNDFVKKCDPFNTESFTVLFKKKFDNLGEYMQRKKMRLENK